ncbi:hypothetical protein ACPCI0_29145 [Streptomyces griseoincarnatus]
MGRYVDPAQSRFIEIAEEFVRRLEASDDPAERALLPEARRTLRALKTPRPPKVRKSEEVLRHQHRQLLRAVAEIDAAGEL